jgi:hypothetical protein
MKTLRSLTIALLLALVTTNLVGPPAWADPPSCTTGTLTITGNVVTGQTLCAGTATIPPGVTSIGGFAFGGATSLTSIIIPKSVTEIGGHAFRGASSLATVTFEADSQLTKIGEYAFVSAYSLASIIIPKSVTEIGGYAFESASSLATVTFEADSQMTKIGDFAFWATTALKSITIPNSVISIGEYAFQDATSLALVTFKGNEPASVGTGAFLNVASNAVANIGFAADFGEAITWNGLTIVRAAGPPAPAAPVPYSGPIPTNYSDKMPSIGDEVTISGLRLNLVTSCTIDGVTAVMSNQSADGFTIVIPEGVEPGLKNLVITGPAGKLTAQGAFTVQQTIPAITNETPTASKTNAGSFNGYVAVYAKGHKGKTLSWKIAGKWFETTITSDFQVFQRKTEAVGLDVEVHLFIDGEKQSTMTVRTS